ncbi:sugar phosphotransferase [Photobacterium gaetbulicola]|nr:sugar phosphotransferase [Photobacterium gaetbulicola]
MMRSLAEGIMVMQINDVESEMYGVLLSWKNLWHGYGNSQAYALLEAGMTLQERDFVKAAFIELDHFHPYLLEQEHLNWFSVKKEDDKFEFIEKHQFAQIAYAVRPIIYSNIRAYQISRDKRYIEQAVEFVMWFFKQNPAAAEMYDKNTGRGYDGIDSKDKYNRNAGAESTIEALLSIQMIESEPEAKKLLEEKLGNK